MCLYHPTGVIGHSELKHVLRQINGNGTSIHFGLLSFEQLIPTTMLTSAPQFDAKKRGESIPSIERTRSGSAGLAFISFWAKPAPPPSAAHVKS